MKKFLVFLESSTKKKTFQKLLGEDYLIFATQGHIFELKKDNKYNLGVDLETFTPSYEVVSFKQKMIGLWKKVVTENDFECIYLATDCDREGGKIAWEIEETLKGVLKNKRTVFKRLIFSEITARAIKTALKEVSELDQNTVDSQTARQVLDRMIGFCISPVLRKQTSAVSAGRVQSVVLRIIIERELEIKNYENSEKKYVIEADSRELGLSFRQTSPHGDLVTYPEQERADKEIETITPSLSYLSSAEEDKFILPRPPFTTSSLITEAKIHLGLSINETTKIAQKLYEGVYLKETKSYVGLISYPRSDKVFLSEDFSRQAFNYISKEWGKEFCNFKPLWQGNRIKHSQEAHESIRPTSLNLKPENLKDSLEKRELLLYTLIFEHSLASLMASIKTKNTTSLLVSEAKEKGEEHFFSTTERVVQFPGFSVVNKKKYSSLYSLRKERKITEKTKNLPVKLKSVKYEVGKPYRFDDGSLVKKMEQTGIGRPSTYSIFAPILLKRRYVQYNRQKQFVPLPLGERVDAWLKQHFSGVINLEYTANLETELDEISAGRKTYLEFIKGFWKEFYETIKVFE